MQLHISLSFAMKWPLASWPLAKAPAFIGESDSWSLTWKPTFSPVLNKIERVPALCPRTHNLVCPANLLLAGYNYMTRPALEWHMPAFASARRANCRASQANQQNTTPTTSSSRHVNCIYCFQLSPVLYVDSAAARLVAAVSGLYTSWHTACARMKLFEP